MVVAPHHFSDASTLLGAARSALIKTHSHKKSDNIRYHFFCGAGGD